MEGRETPVVEEVSQVESTGKTDQTKGNKKKRQNIKNTNKKKKRKVKRKQKTKCQWYKRQLNEEKLRVKRVRSSNCQKMRRNGDSSFETMRILYKQILEINEDFKVLTRRKIVDYKQFFLSLFDFLKTYPRCETNLQWNHIKFQVILLE